MYTGTFGKKRNTVRMAVLWLCIAAGLVGGTVAYLVATSDTLSNKFVPAKVSCQVEEVFENGVKEDVQIRNTGDIDAYIRAAVIVTFLSDDGKVLSASPKEGADYSVTWGADGWQKGADGYWYYKKSVAPGNATSVLLETATAMTAPAGYRLHIQIVATAIQAQPENAVKDAWGVHVVSGELALN